jgi:tetratricopeptide (TPR) repeat protein
MAQTRPDALKEYRAGNYERAVEICRMELEETPGNMDSHTVLGWSLLRLGKNKEALDAGIAAMNQARYDVRIIEIVGEAHYFLGNNRDALKFFEEYCVLAPTGDRIALVYFYMGEIFIRLGEYNHADMAFTTAVYHSANTAKWWARLGYAREMAQDYRYSLEAYDKALQLNTALTEALRGKERVQEKMQG